MTNIIYDVACSKQMRRAVSGTCQLINNICHSFIINESYKCTCPDACEMNHTNVPVQMHVCKHVCARVLLCLRVCGALMRAHLGPQGRIENFLW